MARPPPPTKWNDVERLIDEAEELTRLYIGPGAEGEAWRETLDRLENIAKLVKAIRKKMTKDPTQ